MTGKCPFPGYVYPWNLLWRLDNMAGDEDQSKSWWQVVRPSTEAEDLLQATTSFTAEKDSSVSYSTLHSSAVSWSAYDVEKSRLGLRITTLASTLYRVRAGYTLEKSLIDSTQGDAIGLDLLCVAHAFIGCVDLLRSLQDDESENSYVTDSRMSSHVMEHTSSELEYRGIRSTRILDSSHCHSLIQICEILICTIHDICARASPKEIEAYAGALEACMKVATSFSPHSFINTILRWVEDKTGISHRNMMMNASKDMMLLTDGRVGYENIGQISDTSWF